MNIKTPKIDLKVLTFAEEMRDVEKLQEIIWPGVSKIPAHFLVATAKNSGLVIGAYHQNEIVGFAFGVSAYHQFENGDVLPKHYSHMVGIHPEYQNAGIGYLLKKAQWKLIQRMGIELITWTFDPLESRNGYLNISVLGGICNTYQENIYGDMDDDLNSQLKSDRFELTWWLKSKRAKSRMQSTPIKRLRYGDYEKSETLIINETDQTDSGLRVPYQDRLDLISTSKESPNLILFEMPHLFQKMKSEDISLAKEWRGYTRIAFDLFFSNNYLITDFVVQDDDGEKRSFYVLSKEGAVKGIRDED
jgi:predicted GNAT superfamily acetyltransferase